MWVIIGIGREDPIDPYVLATIASLPQSSAETLDRIAHLDDPRLYHRMGSIDPLLMEHNPHGLAVMRLVARYPNVSATTLTHLAKTKVDYVAGDIASNPKTPIPVLSELYAAAGWEDRNLIDIQGCRPKLIVASTLQAPLSLTPSVRIDASQSFTFRHHREDHLEPRSCHQLEPAAL